jgi:hypothetical protein
MIASQALPSLKVRIRGLLPRDLGLSVALNYRRDRHRIEVLACGSGPIDGNLVARETVGPADAAAGVEAHTLSSSQRGGGDHRARSISGRQSPLDGGVAAKEARHVSDAGDGRYWYCLGVPWSALGSAVGRRHNRLWRVAGPIKGWQIASMRPGAPFRAAWERQRPLSAGADVICSD